MATSTEADIFVLWQQFCEDLSWEMVRTWIQTAPNRYRKWWWNLVQESPGHVIVETALLLFIIWLVFFKKTENPEKDETVMLTEREIDDLIKEWKPEPLVPQLKNSWQGDVELVIDKTEGNLLYVQGYSKPLLNFATFDFLGMGQRPEMKDAARAALEKYGCGSCGPRGFYGTIDVHIQAEEAIADFMGAEEAISYSDAALAVTSTLPAFAKRGDLLVVDQGVHEPIQTALILSRSNVKYFKHNDVQDLERVLKEIQAEDKRLRRNVTDQRRFIVVEGLYKNHGDICPLPELVRLKKKYFYRLFMDETFSFGCYGTGRGVTELYNVPLSDVDILTISMAHALASVGGLCVGISEVVDHQRLSGAGYCFSASAPPFVSSAAIASLNILKKEPALVDALQKNVQALYEGLQKIPNLKVMSAKISPIIHLGVDPKLNLSSYEGQGLLQKVGTTCVAGGLAIVTSKYIGVEKFACQPTLRLTTNATHSLQDIEAALRIIAEAATTALN